MIRNQLFLQKPWTFPVLTTIGAAGGLIYTKSYGNLPKTFSLAEYFGIFLMIVAIFNLIFFWALKRTKDKLKP